MQPSYTHGSSRVMTPERCAKLCELIAASHTIEEAAEAIGVSIHTVQRERKRDENFDHEVLLALQYSDQRVRDGELFGMEKRIRQKRAKEIPGENI